ncbi:hypothetical protein pb186bvf_001183 [Paramecium bursaria]
MNQNQIYVKIVDSLRKHRDGGLMVLSSGINVACVVSQLLIHFLEKQFNSVILLNFSIAQLELIDTFLNDYLIKNDLINNGKIQQEVERLGKAISEKRSKIYKQGGIFSISSQVLMQDLLIQALKPDAITHIIINQCHDIKTKYDYESWILNYMKLKRPQIFTLGLTNRPQLLQFRQNAHIILKQLYIEQKLPWPFNRAEIVGFLKQNDKKWSEFAVQPSKQVKEIQDCLISVIDECLIDINLRLGQQIFTTQQIIQSNEYQLITQLIKKKVRFDLTRYQIFKDIFQIRKLLFQLINSSPAQFMYSFYRLSSPEEQDSVWHIPNQKIEYALTTIKRVAKERFFDIRQCPKPIEYQVQSQDQLYKKEVNLEIKFNIHNPPKLNILVQQLEKIQSDNHQRVWIWAPNQQQVNQIQQFLGYYFLMKDKTNIMNQLNYFRMTLGDYMIKDTEDKLNEILNGKVETTKQPKVVLKKKSNLNQASQDLVVLHSLYQELVIFHTELQEQRFQMLKDNTIMKRNYQYQLIPQELLNLNIQDLGEKIDDFGKLVTFNEDQIMKNMTISINCLDDECHRLQYVLQSKPDHIFMLEPCNRFLRELLIINAQAKIYMIYVEDSIESWKFAKEKLDEDTAFDQLIQDETIQKKEDPRESIKTVQIDDQENTRHGKGMDFYNKKQQKQIIIVDFREFRSEIPSRLYFEGYEVQPCMLKVGDIILSNKCGIERKCVETGDFMESLDKRLDDQLRRMHDTFEYPFLLIEFSDNIQFNLSSIQRIKGRKNRTSVKLHKFIRRYPKLGILWAKNIEETIKLITKLKQTLASEQPDLKLFKNANKQNLNFEKVDFYFSQLEQLII